MVQDRAIVTVAD